MEQRKPVIEFQNFGFQYKSQQEPTLYDINLTIYEGEKVLILGSSGSGKSTLASCINGLIPFFDEGTITGSLKVNGVETREASVFELSKTVGTVLQDSDAQFVGLSVAEDIAFSMENENMPRAQMVPRVKKFAGVVGMGDFLGAVPFNLSGGQKQKVAIAGVLGEQVNTKNGYYIVSPDNGSLTYPLVEFGIDEIREIDETVNRYHGTEKTSIFHGRDLFAYCAARLASGVIDFAGVGPAYPVSEIITVPVPAFSAEQGKATGCITGGLASFGNLDTSIPVTAFAQTGITCGDSVRLTVCHGAEIKFDAPVAYRSAFAMAKTGETLVFHNYNGYLGIGINQGNFSRTYGIEIGADWTVTVRKAE